MRLPLCIAIVATMLFAVFPAAVNAANSYGSYDVKLIRQISSDEDPESEYEGDGHRAPARPVSCLISQVYRIHLYIIVKFDITVDNSLTHLLTIKSLTVGRSCAQSYSAGRVLN